MKILHISTSSSGGAAVAANRLHLGLLDEGYDSNILYLHKSNKIKNGNEFIKKDIGIFFKILRKLNLFKTKSEKNNSNKVGLSKNSTMFSFAGSDYDITKHSKYKEADIINLHWVSEFIDYKSFFRNNEKRIVWTLHDQNPFTGGCHYSENCHKYVNDCDHCHLLSTTSDIQNAKKNLALKLQALKNKNLTIIAPSNWLLRLSIKSTLFSRYNHYHIPYGIDTNIFKPVDKKTARAKFNIPINKRVILFISDKLYEDRKGFKLIKEALSILNKENLLLLAVGKKNEVIQDLDIQYTGHIESEETMNLVYNAADIFVIPSLQDNLPNTMLEAFSCGIPIIGFPVGGINEYLHNGENGILAKNITSAELAVCINDYLDGKYTFVSKDISEFAFMNFNQKKQATSYMNIYKKLLEEGNISVINK